MKSIYENTGNGYTMQGDYALPNVEMDDKTEYQIGVLGQRYRKHLKENHKVLYYNYLTAGKRKGMCGTIRHFKQNGGNKNV